MADDVIELCNVGTILPNEFISLPDRQTNISDRWRHPESFEGK